MDNMTALVSCFARAYHYKNCEKHVFADPVAERMLTNPDDMVLAKRFDFLSSFSAVKDYYAGSDGRLQNGFVTIDGNNFLFDLENFTMIRNTVIPGDGFNYVIDANGIVTEVPIVPEVPETPEVITIPVATAKYEVSPLEETDAVSSDTYGTSGVSAGSVGSAYASLKPVNAVNNTEKQNTEDSAAVTDAETLTGDEEAVQVTDETQAVPGDAADAGDTAAQESTAAGGQPEQTEEDHAVEASSEDQKKEQTDGGSENNAVNTPAETGNDAALAPAADEGGDALPAGEESGEENKDPEENTDPDLKANEDILKPEQAAQAEPDAE